MGSINLSLFVRGVQMKNESIETLAGVHWDKYKIRLNRRRALLLFWISGMVFGLIDDIPVEFRRAILSGVRELLRNF